MTDGARLTREATRAQRALLCIWAASALVAAFGLFYLGARFGVHRAHIRAFETGEADVAQVTQKRKERRLRAWRHRVTYAYSVDGRRHEKTATVRPDAWRALSVGQSIEVRHLDGRHSIAGEAAFARQLVELLPMLSPPILLWMLLALGLFVRTRRRLAIIRDGAPVDFAIVGPVSRWSERALVRFALPAGGDHALSETVVRRIPIAVARFPAVEIPARDMRLFVLDGHAAAVRTSELDTRTPHEDARTLAAIIPELRERLGPRATTETTAGFISSEYALGHDEDPGSAIERFDRLLLDDRLAHIAFTRWLAHRRRTRSPYSPAERRALGRLRAYQRQRAKAMKVGASFFTLVTAVLFFMSARWLIMLAPPADLGAALLMAVLAYPLFRFVIWPSWA